MHAPTTSTPTRNQLLHCSDNHFHFSSQICTSISEQIWGFLLQFGDFKIPIELFGTNCSRSSSLTCPLQGNPTGKGVQSEEEIRKK
ncbi:uncharacterized protein LOC124885622 isoform X3 [Capsicum annuum]|uniref:uncharacterized protein LOC124885622 isoform X3 n=1 Tax=Capsicum annuum TaxID=4072 RepID=UPI001FB171C0|nr:uncharacterized protein LOC124885622 isoform X3 [Capsicum annuum]